MKRKLLSFVLGTVFLGACGESDVKAQETPIAPVSEATQEINPDKVKPALVSAAQVAGEKADEFYASQKMSRNQDAVKTIATQSANLTSCTGIYEQAGMAVCNTAPNSTVTVTRNDGKGKGDVLTTKSDADGVVIIGFDRDEPKTVKLSIDVGNSLPDMVEFNVKPREFGVQRIDGLPPSQVNEYTKEQLARIRAATARKKVGFASRAKNVGFDNGFAMPVDGIKSSDFGNQRILNGVPKRPHYGVDIAAPLGTPIYAPADGTVTLADQDMYFEGALIMLDHGQGLISLYLHVNDIFVEPGQVVKRGEKIGEVGSKGRSTGPHLCWRLKWRNRNLDPEMLTKWPTGE